MIYNNPLDVILNGTRFIPANERSNGWDFVYSDCRDSTVKEDKDGATITVAAPGYGKENVRAYKHQNVLHIECFAEEGDDKKDVVKKSFKYNIGSGKVESVSVKHGIITVVIKRAEAEKQYYNIS